ncbi:MAG: KamA family radical SAM protein [Verrucomicrobia bacterium]|nr:KamA family radical SAM protein [Verrucomicrobiota bacterium]
MWQQILRTNYRSWPELARDLELDEKLGSSYAPFPLNLPRRLAAKIEKGNRQDPILLQFLPYPAKVGKSSFCADPVGDRAAKKAPRLLHKYRGRALLLASSACAMHCRYCFRQYFDYAKGEVNFEQELAAIKTDSSVSEVILSGGDPLSLSNSHLKNLIEQLEGIDHLKRLRFHSRFPIGIPERLDAEFRSLLPKRLQTYFVIHCNHPRELDEEILRALKNLRVPLLNQSVLLKNVNDNLETLKELSDTLLNGGILPYYLHQLDQVKGAEAFEVEEDKGRELIRQLTACMSGYGVPKYVREIAGQPNKSPLL